MPRYKRTADEAELDIPLEPEIAPENVETLTKLRNMWEFAALMQYIFMFGGVVKIDEKFEIENLEAECLKPEPSDKLAQIGLQLLKYVSSHRGLTPDIFDEYARRQYVAKAPTRYPFGDDEDPIKFNALDVFTRVRVLQQLSTWTLGNAERIRGMMPEDSDPLDWRMEPLGWDKDDRAYYVLDDNRLYRRADEPVAPPSPPPKPKSKGKAAPKKSKSRGTRASKRRKVEETKDEEMNDAQHAAELEVKDEEEVKMTNGDDAATEQEAGFGFTTKTWQCIAVTLDDYNDFLATIFRSRDPNEKHLRKMIEERIIPLMEERAERLRQQKLAELRKMEVQAQMASAKRSGRLAAKQSREQEEQEKRDAEDKKKRELREAHEEQERLKRAEEGHESRRQTREQRLKEREMKRILHEEQLARLEEDATRASSQDPASESVEPEGPKRISGRQNKSERERHKQELERLAQEEDNWYFDCVKCHQYGDNFDDGTHSVACEKCNVWQHSACHGIEPEQAEDPNFHFVCARCKQKEEDAKKPKLPTLKLGKSRLSSSPDEKKSATRPTSSKSSNGTSKPNLPDYVARQLDGVQVPQYHPPHQQSSPYAPVLDGPNMTPYGLMQVGSGYPPVGNFAPRPQQFSPPQQPWQGNAFPPPQRPPSSGYAGSPPPPMANGHPPPHQHQQHHQATHHNAVTASGGHPYPQQSPAYPVAQPNGYSPRAPGGMYPAAQTPQAQFHYYQAPPNRYAAQPPMQQPPQMRRPGSQGQIMNGAQSPAKGTNGPPHMSGQPHQQHQRQHSYGQHQYRHPHSPSPPVAHPPPQQPQNITARSPSATFHPQQAGSHQYGQPSPIKSSPQPQPAQQYQQQAHYQPGPPPAQMMQTPTAQQALRPSSSNGYASAAIQQHQQTPVAAPRPSPQTAQTHPSPAGSNANAVAADGMSGPWPEASKVIPEKHDRNPAAAPLPSMHVAPQGSVPSPAVQNATPMPASHSPAGLEAKAIAPPVALSPTQAQQQAQVTGAASVPVKKSPVVDAGIPPPVSIATAGQTAMNGHSMQHQEGQAGQ